MYDCYLCPNNEILSYSTTNRDGYQEYKSCPEICKKCKDLEKCTKSKKHQKVVQRHLWEDYMEVCEDIRCTLGMKELYKKRKETIERLFGTAKENHGFRYTNLIGKAHMEMKVGLTFACMNLKKLAQILQRKGLFLSRFYKDFSYFDIYYKIGIKTKCFNANFVYSLIFKIIVPLNDEYSFDFGQSDQTNQTNQTDQTDQEEYGNWSENELKLLELLKSYPNMTNVNLANTLEWSVSRVKYYIQKFKQSGKIVRKGTNRNGSWKVL